jgi:hypothetical protein
MELSPGDTTRELISTNTNMNNKPKIYLIFLLILVCTIPILPLFDFWSNGVIGYIIMSLSIIGIVYLIAISNIHNFLSIVAIVVFSVSVFAALQAPVVPGGLLGYDQHVIGRFIADTTSTGQIASPEDGLRGAGKPKNYPAFFVFGAMMTKVLGVDPITTTKYFPFLAFALFPIFGYVILPSRKKTNILTSLIWVLLAFQMPSSKLQLFALLPFTILLWCVYHSNSDRVTLIFILMSLVTSISHSFTSIMVLGILVSCVLSNLNDGINIKYIRMLVIYGLILVSAMYLLENRVIFISLAYLILEQVGGVNEALSTASARSPFPRSIFWWASQYIRFFSYLTFGFLGLLVVYRIRTTDRLKWINSLPNMMIMIGGLMGFTFPLVLNVGGLSRGWLFASLFVGVSVPYLIQTINKYGIPSNRSTLYSIISVVAGLSTILLYLRRILRGQSFEPYLTENQVIFLGILLMILSLPILLLRSIYSDKKFNLMNNIPGDILSRVTIKNIIVIGVIGLLLSTTIIAIPISTFSSEERENERLEPGLPSYNTQTEYSVSKFISTNSEDAAVGDRRVFLIEQFYRHVVVEEPDCYTSECKYQNIIWFSTYDTMWQGADDVLVPYSFPDGEQYLSVKRNKIFSNGDAKIFY